MFIIDTSISYMRVKSNTTSINDTFVHVCVCVCVLAGKKKISANSKAEKEALKVWKNHYQNKEILRWQTFHFWVRRAAETFEILLTTDCSSEEPKAYIPLTSATKCPKTAKHWDMGSNNHFLLTSHGWSEFSCVWQQEGTKELAASYPPFFYVDVDCT